MHKPTKIREGNKTHCQSSPCPYTWRVEGAPPIISQPAASIYVCLPQPTIANIYIYIYIHIYIYLYTVNKLTLIQYHILDKTKTTDTETQQKMKQQNMLAIEGNHKTTAVARFQSVFLAYKIQHNLMDTHDNLEQL